MEPLADDLACAGDHHECGGLNFFDILPQQDRLRAAQYGQDKILFLVGKSPFCFQQCGAAL